MFQDSSLLGYPKGILISNRLQYFIHIDKSGDIHAKMVTK